MSDARFVEVLEGRTFLSGATGACPLAAPAGAAVHVPLAAAAIPNVKGTYKGNIAVNLYPYPIPATLKITQQNGTNLKGSITVPGVGTSAFAVTGTIDAQGKYTLNWNKNGQTGKITGKRQPNGSLKGNFTAKVSAVNLVGTFTFVKQ